LQTPKSNPNLGKKHGETINILPFDCRKPQDYVFKHLDHPYNSLNDALRNSANNQMSSIFRYFRCQQKVAPQPFPPKKSNKIMGKPGINMTSPRVPFTECPPPDVEELPPHLYVLTPGAEFWKIMHQTKEQTLEKKC